MRLDQQHVEINTELSADLGKLRVVTSTGAALSPEMYTWFYETGFPRHTHLVSMSGGTDLCGSRRFYL